MTNYLYNILVINAQTDQLVPSFWWGVAFQAWVWILETDIYVLIVIIFFFFLLSAGVLFQVLHVQFYLFSNQSVNDTPFWYHSFKKTKSLSFFVRVHVRLVYQIPGIRGWLRLLLVAFPGLFCLPFFYWKQVTFSFLFIYLFIYLFFFIFLWWPRFMLKQSI